MLKKRHLVFISVIMFFSFASVVLVAAQSASPPARDIWQGKTFTKNTYEEDIKDTLRAIAQLAGLYITFSEGITDTITMEFDKMPLKDAFDFLISQYELDYSLDEHAIHVYKTGLGGITDVLISLENAEMEDVKDAIARFGLMKKEIKIIFDTPSNSIFLSGNARDIGNIRNLINALESAKKKSLEVKTRPEIRYFSLRYAKVNTITLKIGNSTVTVKGLTDTLTEILGLTTTGVDTTAQSEIIEGDRESKSILSPNDARTKILKKMVSAEAGTITDDPRTNRIIIRDYPEKLDEYEKIIKELDQPTKMVKIDVHIIEASKDFARELGFGIVKFKPAAAGRDDDTAQAYGTSGNAREAFDDARNTGSITDIETNNLIPLAESVAGIPISAQGIAGSFLYQGSKWTLLASLNMAETRGISKTINKSSIITMDNMEAIVQSQVSITYKIQTGGDSPTVEDRTLDAGIILNVTPHIIDTEDGKKLVEMVITAERSSFLSTSTDDVPDRSITTLTTQAVIGNDSTLVIGGLFDNRYAQGETGTPCLMDIPGLGNLFKIQSAANPKSNILFFLTPKVISLDDIPYEGPEMIQKIEKSEQELKDIDQDRQEKWIERQ